METTREDPIADRRLARDVVWTLLGTGLPMLVAIAAVPPLIDGLGAARFGVLTLAWIVVGYFSLFDLGLGRAMTQLVAVKLGQGEREEVPRVVWAAMSLMTVLGLLGAAVIALASPLLVGRILEIPPELRAETLTAFYLLAASIPIVIGTTGLRGILEAHQRFGMVNLVRVPLGVLTYLGPLAVLPFSTSLPALVAVLVAVRTVSWAAYLLICIALYPELLRRERLRSDVTRRLLSFGGYMTLSNIVAPLLLYMGRFLVAVLVSAEAVAYFSTPYEVVVSLLIVPGVFVTVLFPAFTQLFQRDPEKVHGLYRRSLLQVMLIVLPAAVLAYVYAQPALAWWIDEEFAASSYRVAQLLAIGVAINSPGHLSQAVVQAYGRPDLTAKLHVAELLAYVPYLWWLTEAHGIDGAAVAWVIRVAISTVVLYFMAKLCLAGALPGRH